MLWYSRVGGWKHNRIRGKWNEVSVSEQPNLQNKDAVSLLTRYPFQAINNLLITSPLLVIQLLKHVCLSDRRQSYGFCELQCLGRSCLHTGGFCLQDAGRDDVCRGCCVLPELCGRLYDAVWGRQPARGDVSVGSLSGRWCGKCLSSACCTATKQVPPFHPNFLVTDGFIATNGRSHCCLCHSAKWNHEPWVWIMYI